MNRDEIIRMAREAGYLPLNPPSFADSLQEAFFARFAALVAAVEREACAKACDDYSEFRWSWWKARGDLLDQGASDAADGLAQCIRSRT